MMKRTMIAAAALALGTTWSQASLAADLAAGKKKAEEVCASCHGLDGNHADPNNPRLAGQYADYLAKALRDYKSGARNNVIMKGFADPLTSTDIANLSAYYAAQPPVLRIKY